MFTKHILNSLLSPLSLQTMAYLMKEYGMGLEEAFSHVKSKRSVINPNHGFMNQLKAYEGILTARYIVRLVAKFASSGLPFPLEASKHRPLYHQ